MYAITEGCTLCREKLIFFCLRYFLLSVSKKPWMQRLTSWVCKKHIPFVSSGGNSSPQQQQKQQQQQQNQQPDLRIRRQHSSDSVSSVASATSHSSVGSNMDTDAKNKKKNKKNWVRWLKVKQLYSKGRESRFCLWWCHMFWVSLL